MKKTFQILFWHGRTRAILKWLTERFPEMIERDGEMIIQDITLDEFAERFDQKFIYLPAEDEDSLPRLAVTQFSTFGQR